MVVRNNGCKHMVRSLIWLGWTLVPLLATGCSYQTEPRSTQPGRLTLTVPGRFPTVVSGAPAANPADGQAGAASSSGPFTPISGRYQGMGRVTNNPGGRCRTTVDLTNWTVSGDRVRFGAFRGTIRSDGSLMMQAGGRYIKGNLAGPKFTGVFWQPGPRCTYSISLDLVE